MKKDNLKGQHRINEQIRAKEVRIVGDNIEPTVVSIHEALRIAEENEADLVEISPNAVPPVCRIIDYSKFLYQLKKKQKDKQEEQSLRSGGIVYLMMKRSLIEWVMVLVDMRAIK